MKRKESSKLKIFNILRKVFAAVLIFALSLTTSCTVETGNDEGKDIKEWDFFRKNAELLEKREEVEEEEEEAEEKNIYRNMHLKLTVTDPGEDIFIPRKGSSYNYRYGPSMLLRNDGSIDLYLSAPGDTDKELDWITYMHSDDGGSTWSDEKVVLSPTPVSKDERSVCDPDVFYFKGYYYLGYTSTIVETNMGIANSVFLARSRYPDGPFYKWNGKGWGGDPEPIIYYDGVWNGWGTGEPSFVILDDRIYVYSTRDAYNADNERVRSTEVHIADIRDENWPAELQFAGYAVIRTDTDPEVEPDADYIYSDSDSWDVAYVEEYGKFVAVSTNRRLTDDSCMLYYESDNGIYFERVSELNENIICGCHNSGIMADGEGHIKMGDPTKIGYAYSGTNDSAWGNWAARIAPVSIGITFGIDRREDGEENLKIPIAYENRNVERYPFFITADSTVKSVSSETENFSIYYAMIDSYRSSYSIPASDVVFSGFDDSIVMVKNGVISPVSEGMTGLTIGYGGISREIRLKVCPGDGSLKDFFSPVRQYTVSLSRPYAVAIRPLARKKDFSIFEMDLDSLVRYGVEFESLDGAICTVREDGIITPLSPGDAKIKVSCNKGINYLVDVCVVE